QVLDDFLPESLATRARTIFEDNFSDPRTGRPDRFVWDWWHVAGQYTLLRTPAQNYLGPAVYQEVTAALCAFGREVLGCTAISPPWLSLYVDGCEQRLHVDGWHGPWAFVLSLTDWDRRGFDGGETLLLKPHVLDYWRGLRAGIGLEEFHLVDEVEPRFNRLTLFDPRVPHGVRPVRGTRDPLRGRLVLHGWFTEPAPFLSGGLGEAEAAAPLDAALERALPGLQAAGRVTGLLAVRMRVAGADGSVAEVSALSDTLVPDPDDAFLDDSGEDEDGEESGDGGGSDGGDDHALGATRQRVLTALSEALSVQRFPVSCTGEDTMVTVPYVFE
ncbi:unnamed protein product, partial [Phaeothamnion confervicola]